MGRRGLQPGALALASRCWPLRGGAGVPVGWGRGWGRDGAGGPRCAGRRQAGPLCPLVATASVEAERPSLRHSRLLAGGYFTCGESTGVRKGQAGRARRGGHWEQGSRAGPAGSGSHPRGRGASSTPGGCGWTEGREAQVGPAGCGRCPLACPSRCPSESLGTEASAAQPGRPTHLEEGDEAAVEQSDEEEDCEGEPQAARVLQVHVVIAALVLAAWGQGGQTWGGASASQKVGPVPTLAHARGAARGAPTILGSVCLRASPCQAVLGPTGLSAQRGSWTRSKLAHTEAFMPV